MRLHQIGLHIKNILRNKFLSFSSILVLTLLIFFINILLVLHDVSFKLIDSINSKLTISLYLEEWYDRNSIEVIDMIEDIQGIDKWILDEEGILVEYKTKDDILDDIRATEPGLVKILERSNPLPETIVLSNIINFVVAMGIMFIIFVFFCWINHSLKEIIFKTFSPRKFAYIFWHKILF